MAATLDERVRALEDALEISNLKARYMNAADGGWDRESHNAALIAPMFVADGWWHSESHDRADGREAIFRMFSSFTPALPFAWHVVANPLITVNGDRASGGWHVIWNGTDAKGIELWAAGIYSDQCVRTDEGWRFESIYCRMAFFGPYADGWADSMGTAKTLGEGASQARKEST